MHFENVLQFYIQHIIAFVLDRINNKLHPLHPMSDFAYFRFLSHNLLTEEERKSKEEIIAITEEVLDAKGIECDSTISKISEDDLKEILEGVRQIRKKKMRKYKTVDMSIEK
jgi:hypothetical protein